MIIPGVLIKVIGKGDVLFGVRGMVISLCGIAVIGGFITVFLVPERKYSLGQSSDAGFKDTMGILFKISLLYYIF